MHILVVEDDPTIVLWLRRVFEEDGHAVTAAASAEEALALARGASYRLLLVDVGLPRSDGLALVTELRRAGARMPILLLTGRADDATVAAGLDAGADDYLTKPVSVTVLRARVRAALRRAAADDEEQRRRLGSADGGGAAELAAGALRLSLATRRARGPAGEVELSAKEFTLLAYLLERAGQVVPREQLLQHVWGYEFDPGTNVVEVALSRLRGRLAEVGPCVRLRTLRGMGVVLERDVAEDGPRDA